MKKDYKRQRDEEEEVFAQSKRTLRSPQQRLREEENMNDIREMFNLQREAMSELTQTIRELKNEMKQMRETMERKEEEWRREKEELIARIDKLEEREVRRERAGRKNNIVVKGLEIREGDEKEQIEKFISEKLQVEVSIKKVQVVGTKQTQIIIAEMNNWEEKTAVMKKKKLLSSTKVYIDNDLTREQRVIQREIREIAREERKKGKHVIVLYQKAIINGEMHEWCNKDRGLNKINTKN